MADYERIREKIAQKLAEKMSATYHVSPTGLLDMARDWTTQILSLDGIEIRADDQNLPPEPEFYKDWGGDCGRSGYLNAKHDMLKAGFIKVIPKVKRIGKLIKRGLSPEFINQRLARERSVN